MNIKEISKGYISDVGFVFEAVLTKKIVIISIFEHQTTRTLSIMKIHPFRRTLD